MVKKTTTTIDCGLETGNKQQSSMLNSDVLLFFTAELYILDFQILDISSRLCLALSNKMAKSLKSMQKYIRSFGFLPYLRCCFMSFRNRHSHTAFSLLMGGVLLNDR